MGWKSSPDDLFANANEAIYDYLTSDGPSAQVTYLGNNVATWLANAGTSVDNQPTFGTGQAQYPKVVIQTGHVGYSTEFVETGGSTVLRMRSEIVVLDEAADVTYGGQTCVFVAASIASSLHQYRDFETTTWIQDFANLDEITITAEPLLYVEQDGLFKIRLIVDWVHHDD